MSNKMTPLAGEPQIEQRAAQPTSGSGATSPRASAARDRLMRWIADRDIVYSRETERGAALPCCCEHLRVGPVDGPDWTKWETELAYLIVG
jgi:hypothetical protein